MKNLFYAVILLGLLACQKGQQPSSQQHTSRNFLVSNKVLQLYFMSTKKSESSLLRELKGLEQKWALRVTSFLSDSEDERRKVLLEWNARPMDLLLLEGTELHRIWKSLPIVNQVSDRTTLVWRSRLSPSFKEILLVDDQVQAKNLADSLCKTFSCEIKRNYKNTPTNGIKEEISTDVSRERHANKCVLIVDKSCLLVRTNLAAVVKAAVSGRLKTASINLLNVKSGFVTYAFDSASRVKTSQLLEKELKLWLLGALAQNPK